jgi:hypothetical protein
MPSPRRNRERREARRAPFREPRQLILIVCEGSKTEPQYFNKFSKSVHNQLVELLIVREHGVPRTLVETAKQRKSEAIVAARQEKDENLVFDSIWCVFDMDTHPNVADAKEMSRDNDIRLAVSNPCFELWLLLHFRDHPGMKSHTDVKAMLATFVADYDKSIDYARYSDGYEQAVERARRLDEAAEKANEAGRNPTTGVYKLTELIRGE